MKPSELARKSNKPIMEKRRRARINNCLNELKALILDALKKDPSRHTKLEKADILDMTVKYLQGMRRQQMALSAATDPNVISKFRAGFGECADEVSKFVSRADGVDACVKQQLVNHLTSYIKTIDNTTQRFQPDATATNMSASIVTSPGVTSSFRGLHLIPTRLASGEIVFLLPASTATQLHQQQSSAIRPASTLLPAASPPAPTVTSSTADDDVIAYDLSLKSPSVSSTMTSSSLSPNTMTSPLSPSPSPSVSEERKDPWRPW